MERRPRARRWAPAIMPRAPKHCWLPACSRRKSRHSSKTNVLEAVGTTTSERQTLLLAHKERPQTDSQRCVPAARSMHCSATQDAAKHTVLAQAAAQTGRLTVGGAVVPSSSRSPIGFKAPKTLNPLENLQLFPELDVRQAVGGYCCKRGIFHSIACCSPVPDSLSALPNNAAPTVGAGPGHASLYFLSSSYGTCLPCVCVFRNIPLANCACLWAWLSSLLWQLRSSLHSITVSAVFFQ